MTLGRFQKLLGQVSKLCDKACDDVKEKRQIENGLIKLWNEYMELKEKDSE